MPKLIIWSNYKNPTIFSQEELGYSDGCPGGRWPSIVSEEGIKERGFIYDVYMEDFSFDNEAIIWAEENLKEDFTSMDKVLFFKLKEDRTIFALRWL